MKSYSAAWLALLLTGGAFASAFAACATGTDTPPLTMGFNGSSGGTGSTSSSGGNGSSGAQDATMPSGSSSGYGGDDTGNTSSSSSSSSSGAGDDSPVVTPGPTCTGGQACVDGVPSGWTGFVQLVIGTGPDAGAACAAPYNTVQPALGGQTNPDGGPATCGTCSCAVPDSGLGCTVQVEGDNTGCNPILGAPPQTTVSPNVCTKVTTMFGNGANGHVSTPSLTSGDCIPQGGAVTSLPPPPTSTTAVACAVADGGTAADGGTSVTCASGQACAAVPVGGDGGMPSGVCVYQAGIQTCPPGGTTIYTNAFVVGALEDGRGCGCACDPPTCPGDGYVAGFTNTGCTGAPSYTFDAGAACTTINSNRPTYVQYHLSRSGSLGACGAATGGPSGGVDIDGGTATTFCCVP